MEICPNCGMGSHDKGFCLECGVKVTSMSSSPDQTKPAPDRELCTKAVYKAPDELAALTVQKVLEAEGIRAWIQSIQIPWYDGIMKMVEGYWGKVVVFEDEEEAAQRAIEDYLKSRGPGLH